MRGLIIHKKRELLVPEPFWEKALAEYKDGICFTLARKSGLVIERNEGTFSVEDVKGLQDDLAEDEVFFWLMDAAKFHSEDMMPFVVRGKDDDSAEIVGIADGTFPNFIPTASDHSNEYFLFNKYLIPKLNGMGSEFDAVFNNLGNDVVKMELQGICGDRGTIVFLAKNGRNIRYEKNDLMHEYDWGTVSNHLDYKEETDKMPEGVVQAARKLGAKLMGKGNGKTQPVKQIASTEPIKPPKTETKPVETPAAQPKKMVKVAVPNNLSTKAKKNWFRRKFPNGVLPYGWRDMKEIEVPENSIKDLKDLGTYASVVSKPLPVSAPKLIEAFQEDFGIKDKNSTVVPDPETMLRDKMAIPSFWDEYVEVPKNFTDAWTWEQFKEAATKYPLAIAKLAWSYRNEDILVGEEETEEVTEPDTSGTGVVKDELAEPAQPAPAAKPAPAAAPAKRLALKR